MSPLPAVPYQKDKISSWQSHRLKLFAFCTAFWPDLNVIDGRRVAKVGRDEASLLIDVLLNLFCVSANPSISDSHSRTLTS